MGFERRSRGVHQQRDVAQAHALLHVLDLVACDLLGGDLEAGPVEEPVAATAAQVDDLAQVRRALKVESARFGRRKLSEHLGDQVGVVHRAGRAGGGQQDPDVGVADDLAQLMGAEAPVDRHRDRAELGDREDRDHEVEAVRHEDADLVAALHTEPAQRASEIIRESCELWVRDARLGEDERLVVGACRLAVDEIAQCRRLDEHRSCHLLPQSVSAAKPAAASMPSVIPLRATSNRLAPPQWSGQLITAAKQSFGWQHWRRIMKHGPDPMVSALDRHIVAVEKLAERHDTRDELREAMSPANMRSSPSAAARAGASRRTPAPPLTA